MSTTWANLPEELFEKILDVYMFDNVIARQDGFVHTTKNDLGKLALVNRYFADICQSKIFHTLTLRSRADIHELLQLIETPGSHIADYISWLELPPQSYGSSDPWIHLFYLISRKLYSQSVPLTITIQAKRTSPQEKQRQKPVRIRSIHPALPRSVPAIFSNSIEILILEDVHFAVFTDFIHLVQELRRLKTLKCTAVTWTGEPLSFPRNKSHVPLQFVVMTRCTMDWCAMWMLIALGREHREIEVTERDLTALMESVQLFPATPRGDIHPTIHSGFVDTWDLPSLRTALARHLECRMYQFTLGTVAQRLTRLSPPRGRIRSARFASSPGYSSWQDLLHIPLACGPFGKHSDTSS